MKLKRPAPAKLAATLACAALALTPAYAANTLCVTNAGQYGCYHRITDAVAAAGAGDTILVGPGTYKEGVFITRPLSLVGIEATIDASNESWGVIATGLGTPGGLSSVHISGFTIQNANFEGVLVLNASAVTVSLNTVQNNNKALAGGKCTDLPPFETNETPDCGEGIHLQAADHSIVTNNIVHGNSGGILLSDDTGTTHDNLISNNVVSDNPYACGITMASHVPAPLTGATTAYGVFHNTVYKNQSMRNGLSNGGGAGVGIYASAFGTMSYGNVVVENVVSENGLPGITMHAHAPNQLLNDNMVVGNISSNNGADTEDAITPGPTGINIYSLTPVTGNIFSGNTISNESYGITVKVPALVQVEFNALPASGIGIDNLGTVGTIDATENWWGCFLGPTYGSNCSKAAGPNVWSEPWLLQPLP